MWKCVLCIVAVCFGSGYGYLGDQMAEVTQLCCNQGTSSARNHTSDDCSASIPPDVPAAFGPLCNIAIDQCCKEYHEKQTKCETGIEVATSGSSCSSVQLIAKSCCEQCVRGRETGSTRGASACSTIQETAIDADQLLAGDAFSQCCKGSAEKSHRSKPSQSKPVRISRKPEEDEMYSICEEYAPNELCAHHCIPVPGSYKCDCNPGYMLMPDRRNCKEIPKNRCKPHNPCQHKCNDNGVEVKCSCRRGYELMPDGKSCQDIDECLLNPPVCLSNTQCSNIMGSYRCIPVKVPKTTNLEKGKCPPGFARSLQNNVCDDINECKLPNPPCPFYLCENTVGGYKCGGVSGDPANLANNPKQPFEERCPPGFRTGFNEECEDIDECANNKDDCNKLSQFCINTRGSFYCQDKVSKHCPPGFKTNPTTNKCEDIDECEDADDICRRDQICVNVPGEYDCKAKIDNSSIKCPDGMRRNIDTRGCEDVDECMEGTHLCDQYQNCLNTNGSHECRCKLGFESDSTTGACVDINECATDQNNCIPESQRCDNTVGSYLCIRFISCGTGYILHHSSSTCEDVDECALGKHNCDRAGPEYQCVNIPGSFRCQRRPRTTPPPVPEMEYEYYDSEEEIEEEKKEVVKPTVQPETITTTTPKPEPTTPKLTPQEEPTPIEAANPEPKPTEAVHTTTEENSINTYFEPKPEVPETFEGQPDINQITVTDIDRGETKPSYSPVETTYSPIPEHSPPSLVHVNVGPETATVIGEKRNDGTVVVNTNDVPENEWTKVKELPKSCPIGFESDAYGACFDIDECASNRHSCSGLTERCRNTMGGYLCDCAHGFRRDLASGVCVYIVPPSTTKIPPTLSPHIPTWPTIPMWPTQRSTPTFIPTESSRTTEPPTRVTDPPSRATDPPTRPTDPPTIPTEPPMRPTEPPARATEPPTSTEPPPTTTPPTERTTPRTTPAPTTVRTTSSTRKSFWGYSEYWPVSNRPFRPRNICDFGYHLNSQTGVCEDINECTNGQANCDSVEICVNTEGGYRCDCQPHWHLDVTRHRCVPTRNNGQFPTGYGNQPTYNTYQVNEDYGHGGKGGPKFVEPEITQVEDKSAFKCPWGYILGEDRTCEDVNECATGEAKCGPLQICTNLPGGYTCSCLNGYKLVGDHECEDIDECNLGGAPICSSHADCVNTIGSYQCKCHEGFKTAPANDKVCIDVDECTEARQGSLCQQRCNNVWGSYRCSCHRGYRLNPDNRTCSDVNECTEFKSNIPCVGRCMNEPGSYRCTCPSGYRLSEDKRSCIDIDECETGQAPCASGGQYGSSSDVCTNTRGGFRCHRISCPPGYRLEGKHRCNIIDTVCPPSDWECAHKPSKYSYHYLTFVSNLYIPASKVDLFTMRGPTWPYATMRFKLRLVEVNAPPTVKQADFNAFTLTQTKHEAVVSLVRSLEGPQTIELEVSMELYNGEMYGGSVVARLFIIVSEYEF